MASRSFSLRLLAITAAGAADSALFSALAVLSLSVTVLPFIWSYILHVFREAIVQVLCLLRSTQCRRHDDAVMQCDGELITCVYLLRIIHDLALCGLNDRIAPVEG